MIADQKFHHNVYVILLEPGEPGILRHPSIIRLNPNRDPAKPCVSDFLNSGDELARCGGAKMRPNLGIFCL